MKRSVIAVAAILLSLAACTTPTPYQPLTTGAPVSGGYKDQVLDDTHFRVTFSGNDVTSREQVETYLLYRAAELTAAHGYDWFEMVDRHTENTGDTFIDPSFYAPSWGFYWRPTWRSRSREGWIYARPFWADPWGPYSVDTIDRFSATADIVVGHGAKPAGDPRAFDARQVLANLGPKIVRPGEPH